MRIDKLLWFLRLARSRSLAQAMVGEGHIRLNGRRVERGHAAVQPGDILVLPRGSAVLIIRIISLPPRRGPASEAFSCYTVLDGDGSLPIAPNSSDDAA